MTSPTLSPALGRLVEAVSAVLVAAGLPAVVPWYDSSDPAAEPWNRTGLVAIARADHIALHWRTPEPSTVHNSLRGRMLQVVRRELAEGLAQRGYLEGRDVYIGEIEAQLGYDGSQPALEVLLPGTGVHA